MNLLDRILETSTTTGTGNFTLLGAQPNYQSFSVASGSFLYCIEQQNAATNEWEIGIGSYAAGVLTRTTVLRSTNSNALVSFSAGTKNVFMPDAADRENGGTQTIVGTGASQTGTLTVPAWATWLEISGVSPGGGGGSGRRGNSGSFRNGGNGGDGGSRSGPIVFLLANLGTFTFYYTVGAYGAGGAAVSAVSTDGNPGGDGGLVSVQLNNSSGAHIFDLAYQQGTKGGLGGNSASLGGATQPDTLVTDGQERGGIGGIAASTTNFVNPRSTWSAGAGGQFGVSANASNVDQGTSAPGVAGIRLASGGNAPTNEPLGGDGGTGGAAGVNGGAGADYGGGGGGGGYGTSTTVNSGAGGNGGKGILRFRWW